MFYKKFKQISYVTFLFQTWNKFVVCSQALYELLDSEEDGEVYQKDVVVYL